MAKGTPAQRRALREIDLRIVQAESITKIITAAIRYGAIAYIAWTGLQAVKALAGQYTRADFDFALRFIISEKLDEVFAWAVGIGGMLYGWRERNFRKDDIERRSGRIAELERRIDPGRSSSNLDKRGGTNPEDQ